MAEWLRKLALTCIATALICSSGCSTFSRGRGSLSDYEATRRSIENPVDLDDVSAENPDYLPEGLSAERDKGKGDILRSIGLRSDRRKDMKIAQSHYEAAEKQLELAKAAPDSERAEAFRKAAAQYKLAAKNWKSSGLEQNALLMAAECHFFAEDYYAAEDLYAELIKEYPRNKFLDHVNSRQFEIADYWLKVDEAVHKPFVMVNVSDKKFPWNDTGGHGKRLLEEMRLANPTGKISDDATLRLAIERFNKRDFENAADTFADLRMTYPDSEHQFNAQMLELQSLLGSYQGSSYSSLPLTDAEKRIKQIVRQFPPEAQERQQELNETFSKIRFLRAERHWDGGEYHRKRQEGSSARFYYQMVLDEFSDTPFAEKARERIEQLSDAPDDPPRLFNGLAWALGADNDDRPWEAKK